MTYSHRCRSQTLSIKNCKLEPFSPGLLVPVAATVGCADFGAPPRSDLATAPRSEIRRSVRADCTSYRSKRRSSVVALGDEVLGHLSIVQTRGILNLVITQSMAKGLFSVRLLGRCVPAGEGSGHGARRETVASRSQTTTAVL